MAENPGAKRFTVPPKWAQEAVWYQIFVERFYNGDPANDPVTANMLGAWPHEYSDDWQVTPWTSDWYQDAPFSADPLAVRKWYDRLQGRRYGGDLQGVIDKLDYIQGLGITAIYLNPVNDAPSAHKYDVRNYHHADVHFGPDPKGDRLLMSRENPQDPNSWCWTSADLLFLQLIEEVHARGMKIIVDFSFNHTGIEFWAWRDILVNGINSSFADWYDISMFIHRNPNFPQISFNSWSGVKELPQFRKKYFTHHKKGFPYRGDLHPEIKNHIFSVVKRWLAPDGDVSRGIDGFRLDVADEIGLDFWQEFRIFVKDINPEAFLIGEVWWEDWPHKMMDPVPYLTNGVFDSVMFYQPYKPTRDFFAKTVDYKGGTEFLNRMRKILGDLPDATVKAMMTMSASHDSPRLLTSFFNIGTYKYLAKPLDDVHYKTRKPDDETYSRVRNFLVFQFTMPGSPQIWAGDEMGMWGADDPDCRKPLWWPEFKFEPETRHPFSSEFRELKDNVGFDQEMNLFYRKIIDLRRNHDIFVNGSLRFILAKDDLLIYMRKDSKNTVYVIFNNSNEMLYLNDLNIEGTDLWNGRFTPLAEVRKLKPLQFRIIEVKQTFINEENE